MPTKPAAPRKRRLRVQEIEVERLLLREPGRGRMRAVLETVPARGGRAPGVRLTLLAPSGDVALVADVNARGEPTLHVGNPDRGTTATVTPDAVDLWAGGNVVGTIRSADDGGRLELAESDGKLVHLWPTGDRRGARMIRGTRMHRERDRTK